MSQKTASITLGVLKKAAGGPRAVALVLGLSLVGCDSGEFFLDAGRNAHDGGSTQAHDASLDVTMVEGKVDGADLDAKSALFGWSSRYVFAFSVVPGRHQEVAITDFADECGSHEVIGRILYFDLFQDLSIAQDTDVESDGGVTPASAAADASVVRPATFKIWAPTLNGDGPPARGNIAVATYALNTASNGHSRLAQSGSVTVQAISGREISATFDLHFALSDETAAAGADMPLTGAFKASFCKDWARGSSPPGSSLPVQ